MLFNSFNFSIFLPIVFICFWVFAKGKLIRQNLLLLVASYFFYGCWDVRFLGLLLFSTGLDYVLGLKIQNGSNDKLRKGLFILSLLANICLLVVFKYYNFFMESLNDGFSFIGINSSFQTLNFLLPIGISFYTFHSLSYIIDIYKKKINAETNVVDYALFISFFPLLVAGPIERANHLLPQFKSLKRFDYSSTIEGLKQILWGLFKKVVIADQCAEYVDLIFSNPADESGSTMLVGAVLFSFQIYGDFSGYSDIAIGTARLFGIDLLKNFSFPYFSRSIAEFWRRWHISLSSWFKDYVYIPLGGSYGAKSTTIRNVIIVFLLTGFWHGANWTFIFWGLLNALLIIPSIIRKTNRNHLEIVAKGKILPSLVEISSICFTFLLISLSWIFFRSENLNEVFSIFSKIFSSSIFSIPTYKPFGLFIYLMIVLFFEWKGREGEYAFSSLNYPKIVRWVIYYGLVLSILYFCRLEHQFIYFEF